MPLHILLVEHDEFYALRLKGQLTTLGHDVKVTNSGETALHWLCEAPHGFDVVITGLNLPELAKPAERRSGGFGNAADTPGGIWLINELHHGEHHWWFEHLPIIAWFRQVDDVDVVIRVLRSGADDFLSKSAPIAEVNSHIMRLVASAQQTWLAAE